ncbi:MAG: hypothetical protein FWE37_06760 [Spirochaetaceae bacterium]|nr:hypothetical protein [Spirochaetaceae bacterium]
MKKTLLLLISSIIVVSCSLNDNQQRGSNLAYTTDYIDGNDVLVITGANFRLEQVTNGTRIANEFRLTLTADNLIVTDSDGGQELVIPLTNIPVNNITHTYNHTNPNISEVTVVTNNVVIVHLTGNRPIGQAIKSVLINNSGETIQIFPLMPPIIENGNLVINHRYLEDNHSIARSGVIWFALN